MHALAVLREVSPRWLDAVVASGELASSRIVAAALRGARARRAWVDARDRARHRRRAHRRGPDMDRDGRAVRGRSGPGAPADSRCSAGSSAPRASGVTTTLGRGGSDYSAAIVGACLGRRRDSDLDRRRRHAHRRSAHRPDVRRSCRTLSFAEASELAYFGAKVLHPATIQPAVAKNIPGAHPQLTAPGEPGDADHRRGPSGGTAADGDRVQARRHRRRHHVDADADGARFPAAALRGLRALQDARSTS